MEFETKIEHQAFPGIINGGIISTLLDCHGNWAATMALMEQNEDENPPCTVTATFSLKLRRPTPLDSKLEIIATVSELSEDRANVKMTLEGNGLLISKTEEEHNLVLSSRTDAGVHATGQIFDFSSNDNREIIQWLKGLNSLLPNDISVSSIQKVPDEFHSRFDAINRTYSYIIYTGKTQPIFLRDYIYWEKHEIDLETLLQ